MTRPKQIKRTQKQQKSPPTAQATGTSFFGYLRSFFLAPEVQGIFALTIVALAIIIYCYPFPATMSDSGDYVLRAQRQAPGVFRPFGYSWFLAQVHKVFKSVGGLVAVQGLLQVASLIYFIRAVYAYFSLEKKQTFRWALIILLALSPVHLYLVNTILSDSLFASLSLLWLASGMYLVRRLQWFNLLLHLVVLFLVMKVRYIGVIYPALTALIFVLGRRSVWQKAFLVLLPLTIGLYFYTSTKQNMYRRFRVETFSGFGGWQLANNALHTFPYFELKPEFIPDRKIRDLYQFVRLFGDTIYPAPDSTTTAFMWDIKSPLKQYFLQKIRKEYPSWGYGNQWLFAGNQYTDFGNFFIRRYPGLYFQHWVLPNLRDVIHPPLGFVSNYLENKQGKETTEWFGLPKDAVMPQKVPFFENWINGWLSAWYAGLAFMSMALFLAALFFRRRFHLDPFQGRIILIWITFIGIFAFFSAYASTIEIRYLAPLYPVYLALIIVLLSRFNANPSK